MTRFRAYPVYLLLTSVSALLRSMFFTAAAVYYVTVVGLNPFQLVLVGTTLMVVILVSEVPTGVVADVYSRRLSIIIGNLLIGCGFVLEGLVPHFAAILTSQLIWGIGVTFMSGATEAWIADEVGEANVGPVYLRGAQAGQVGALVGIALGIGLASVQLNLALVAAGVTSIMLGIVLLLIMPEHGFTPKPRGERSSWQSLGQTLRQGLRMVRRRPVLTTILGIAFFYGMASETYDRLWEVHFLGNFAFPSLLSREPVVWFGAIRATALVLSVVMVELARRRLDTTSSVAATRALFGLTLLLLLGVVGFGLAASFPLALVAYLGAYLCRETIGPIFTAWLNQGLDSQVRATVLSLTGQVDAIGQIAGGPLFGALATAQGTPTAMVTAGLVLAPALLLFLRAMRINSASTIVSAS